MVGGNHAGSYTDCCCCVNIHVHFKVNGYHDHAIQYIWLHLLGLRLYYDTIRLNFMRLNQVCASSIHQIFLKLAKYNLWTGQTDSFKILIIFDPVHTL